MPVHAIILKKSEYSKNEAKKEMKKKNINFMRETPESYRLRVIPKTKFDYSTFRTLQPKKGVSIVIGKLKN